jgi:hypothetical protein
MPACCPATQKNAPRVYMIQGKASSLLLEVEYLMSALKGSLYECTVHSSSDPCTHHTTHFPQLPLHFHFQTAKTHTGTHTYTPQAHAHTPQAHKGVDQGVYSVYILRRPLISTSLKTENSIKCSNPRLQLPTVK